VADPNVARVLNRKTEGKHGHAPNQELVGAERLKARIKRKAVEHPEVTPAQLLRTELPGVSSGIISQMPERENLKKAIRTARLKDMPNNPLSLGELGEISARYQSTLGGEPFLLHDTRDEDDDEEGGDEEERLLVFGTRRNVERLLKCTEWFVDGTFKTAAHLFLQLFTILGLVRSPPVKVGEAERKTALPLVYALMTSKQQVHYSKVLDVVKSAATRFRVPLLFPTSVMADFEVAILNAVKAMIPDSIVRACFFHLGQSMYRKVAAVGLQKAYNDPEDRSVKNAVHSLLALAFVPLDDVVDTFIALDRSLPAALREVSQYFDETYVRGPRARRQRRGVAQRPRYDPALWNTYDATLRDEHRTNNLSEGWHNRFQGVIGKNHPSIYAALGEIQKEQADTETMLHELTLGRRVKAAPKKKWLDQQRRVKAVVSEYGVYKDEDRVLDYLRTLGHLFTL
ncbi:GPI ethanolamine phosphate transferase 1, partial [Frankliniella fusca]